MKKQKGYTEEGVINSLSKRNDCVIKDSVIFILTPTVYKNGKTMENPLRRNDLGNGSLGKIDFLVNYRDYRTVKISDFSNKTMKFST